MSETAYQTFRHIFENRKQPKIEWIVDGYSGFLFLDKNGRTKTAMHLQNCLRCMEAKYVKLHGKKPPHVSPHVLRHTFCTNMQQAGIDVKSLQYLRGIPTPALRWTSIRTRITMPWSEPFIKQPPACNGKSRTQNLPIFAEIL